MNNENFEEVIERISEQKINIRDRIDAALETAKDFVEDHSEGICLTILYGGCAILFGQSIRYMHLLNKHAKNGQFFVGSLR